MKIPNRDKYSIREKLKQEIEEKKGWYFIAFVSELPPKRPYGFTLFNKPFALFRNNNDDLVCYCLTSDNEQKKGDRLEIQSFKIEKKGEIWFWRGKI